MRKKGFTLVEVLIATAIMVSVLGALVYSLTQSANLTETVRNSDIALNAAQDSMEKIRDLEDVGDCSNPDEIMDYDDCNFPVTGLTAPSGQAQPGQVSVTQVTGTDLYNVTATVSWQQRGARVISRTLETTLLQR